MKKLALMTGIALLLWPTAGQAADAELRDVALQNGCPPKKITLLRQKAGLDNTAVYKVDCNLPKPSEQKEAAQPGITVTCRMNLCQIMR